MIRKISLIVQCNSLNVTNTRVAAIIRHEKQKDMKKKYSPGVQYPWALLGIRVLNLS